MILGTKARYAVMALVELAGRPTDAPVSLAELAASQQITVPYLEQIFNKLKQHGLVKSVRGPGGGYLLAKTPAELNVAEIIAAAEESTKMTRCEKKAEGCMANKSHCVTHHLWEGLENHIQGYLSGISLADVRARKF
jgi:Rrf2 family iron-sulfur cluster assembly transcriptional regulator